jgi:hypothetical protein
MSTPSQRVAGLGEMKPIPLTKEFCFIELNLSDKVRTERDLEEISCDSPLPVFPFTTCATSGVLSHHRKCMQPRDHLHAIGELIRHAEFHIRMLVGPSFNPD